MEVEHFILAQNSAVDRDSNALSVFGILEDINIQAVQKQFNIPLQAVVVLKRSTEENSIDDEVRFTVTGPDNKVIVSQVIPLKVSSKHTRQRLRVNVAVSASASGEYKFRLDRKDDFSSERSIVINIVPQIGPHPHKTQQQ